MKTFILMVTVLILTACASSEEKVKARFDGWAEACGYPNEPGVRVPPEDEPAFRTCVRAHEQAWQAQRALSLQRGATMLGLGQMYMEGTSPGSTPALDCMTIPHGIHVITKCR